MSEPEASDKAALRAIEHVQQYLRDAYIVDGCRTLPSFGCASCEAIALERQLELVAADIRENLPDPVSANFAPTVRTPSPHMGDE